jgi:hypothetical protein
MDGTISVRKDPSSAGPMTLNKVSFLMVSAKDLDIHISELTNKGISVLDKYSFRNLGAVQKGTGSEKTLLILGSKNGQSQLISTLQYIASTLP